MKFVGLVITALTAFLLPLVSAEEHGQARRHHRDLARRSEGNVDLNRRQSQNSKWSWYDTQTGNAGSCGRHLNNGEMVVAMNVPQYRASNCYRNIILSWHGIQQRAQIVDMCPGCPYGGLDLSPALFQRFAPLGTGIIWDGAWWFEGEGPEPPRPTTTRTTPRPTPSPTPTTTSRRRTSTTRTSTSTTPTTTRASSTSTTSSTSSSSSSSSTSSSAEATPTSNLRAAYNGNLEGVNFLAVSLAQVLIGGAAQFART